MRVDRAQECHDTAGFRHAVGSTRGRRVDRRRPDLETEPPGRCSIEGSRPVMRDPGAGQDQPAFGHDPAPGLPERRIARHRRRHVEPVGGFEIDQDQSGAAAGRETERGRVECRVEHPGRHDHDIVERPVRQVAAPVLDDLDADPARGEAGQIGQENRPAVGQITDMGAAGRRREGQHQPVVAAAGVIGRIVGRDDRDVEWPHLHHAPPTPASADSSAASKSSRGNISSAPPRVALTMDPPTDSKTTRAARKPVAIDRRSGGHQGRPPR